MQSFPLLRHPLGVTAFDVDVERVPAREWRLVHADLDGNALMAHVFHQAHSGPVELVLVPTVQRLGSGDFDAGGWVHAPAGCAEEGDALCHRAVQIVAALEDIMQQGLEFILVLHHSLSRMRSMSAQFSGYQT